MKRPEGESIALAMLKVFAATWISYSPLELGRLIVWYADTYANKSLFGAVLGGELFLVVSGWGLTMFFIWRRP